MEAVAERARVMELVQALPDDRLPYVLRILQSPISGEDFARHDEAERKRALLALCGSVKDESFVRPEQPPLEQRHEL